MICDKKAIPVSGNISMAFELLYKVFYVFDVDYPVYLRPVYEFMDMIFHMKPFRKGLKASKTTPKPVVYADRFLKTIEA